MRGLRSFLWGALLCLGSLSAVAQWQWLDQNGRHVYSDRPPPPEIPQKSIVRQAGTTRPKAVPTPSASREAGPSGSSTLPQGLAPVTAAAVAEKDLKTIETARLLKETESSKHKAEQDKVNQIRAENCQRAQRGTLSYTSGARIFIINPQGEREVLDDASRDVELQRLQSIIQADCSWFQ